MTTTALTATEYSTVERFGLDTPNLKDTLTDELAVMICQKGGHIPNRDRTLPGSCTFHQAVAASYIAVAYSTDALHTLEVHTLTQAAAKARELSEPRIASWLDDYAAQL